jgi:hypothetical protein
MIGFSDMRVTTALSLCCRCSGVRILLKTMNEERPERLFIGMSESKHLYCSNCSSEIFKTASISGLFKTLDAKKRV